MQEELDYFKKICDEMTYFGEEENKAASALIEALTIDKEKNFYNYYERKY